MTDIQEKEPEPVKLKTPRKRAPNKKPEFTDAELAEFKAWKEQRAVKETISCAAADDDAIYRMWKEESKIVKGIFRCREPDGGSVKFSFRKYKWDPIKWYTMVDGRTYEIPLAVARHLNKNCSYAVHSHILDQDGNPTLDTSGKTKSRMNFESTEFAMA